MVRTTIELVGTAARFRDAGSHTRNHESSPLPDAPPRAWPSPRRPIAGRRCSARRSRRLRCRSCKSPKRPQSACKRGLPESPRRARSPPRPAKATLFARAGARVSGSTMKHSAVVRTSASVETPPPRKQAMKILVVDDHSLITDALSVLFLDLDPEAEVITTRTAESALQLQQQNLDLDLVVLDLGLPGVSGTSLLEAMVAQAPEMKILVLSGQQDQRNVMRVLQARRGWLCAEVDGVRNAAVGGEVRTLRRRVHPGGSARGSEPLRHVRCAGSATRGGPESHRADRTAGTGASAARRGARRSRSSAVCSGCQKAQ